jgi:peptide deformylase
VKKLELKIYPDSVLKKKALYVNDIDGSIQKLIKSMSALMYRYKAIGLAANQVGILKRIITVDAEEYPISLINPEITGKYNSDELEEGCLSLPKIHINVSRPQIINICGLNSVGKEIEQEFTGLTARVIQHEIAHLNGILIVDHASFSDRIRIVKSLDVLEEQFSSTH